MGSRLLPDQTLSVCGQDPGHNPRSIEEMKNSRWGKVAIAARSMRPLAETTNLRMNSNGTDVELLHGPLGVGRLRFTADRTSR